MRLTNLTLAGDLRLAGLLALTLAGLAGCPKNDVHPPVTVEAFSASHTAITSGETVIFRWKAANAIETTIRLGDTEIVKRTGRSAADGSFAATLTSGGEYVLTAKGAGEDTKSGTVSVAVSGAPAISSFAATPAAVATGETSTLSWTTSEATSMEIRSPQGLVFRSEDPAELASGSRTVTVFADTTYTMEARNSAGGTVAEATVALVGAPSIEFRALPGAVISGGDEVTLSWTTTGATDVSLTADGQAIDLSGQSPQTGSVKLTPASTTTYVLVATGPGGTARREQLVQVNARPSIGNFRVAPSSIELGKAFPLMSWTTQNADAVVVHDQHGRQVDLQGQAPRGGTINLAPPIQGNYVYTLTASGPGGEVQETATLEVIAPVPEIVSFSGTTTTLNLPTTGRQLSWSTRFATHVEIWEINGATPTLLTPPNAPPTGSFNWVPTVEGVYKFELRAFGPDGLVSDPARNPTIQIKVDPALPTITFVASKPGILSGDSFTLNWTTTGSDRPLTLEESTVSETQGYAPLELFGAGAPVPEATATPVSVTRSLASGEERAAHYFRLTARNSRGATVAVVKVTVGTTLPQVLSFAGTPNPVRRNADLELSWAVAEATSVKIFEGDALLYDAPFYQVVTGARVIQPTVAGTHVYRLEAQGDGGRAIQEVTVEVSGAAPIFDALSATPTTLPLGRPATVTWRTTGATTVSIRQGGVNVLTDLPADGQAQVTPTSEGAVVYEVVASSSGGSITRTVTLQVQPALAEINTFAATPTTLNVGQSLTLSWTASHAFGAPILTDLNAPEVDYSPLVAGQQASSGTITWTPSAPGRHRFQLTVNGANPAPTKSEIVEVAINGAAPDFGFSFAVTPPAGTLGKPVTLTWNAQTADRVLAQPYLPSNDGRFTAVAGEAATDLSLSPTATALELVGDDQQVVLPFPADFKFPFYGEDMTEARVSVNGFVGFGEGHDTGAFSVNGPVGAASQRGGFVAPFWDDLKMFPESGAFWELVGTAPERSLVIQWNKVGFYVYGAGADAELTFQAVLHERGEVEYRYLTMEALASHRAAEVQGSRATIGIQSPRSVDGSFNHSVNQDAGILAGTSLRIQQAIGEAAGEFTFVPHSLGELRYHLHAVGYPATADSEWKTLIVSPPSRALTFTADRTHVGAGNALVLTWTSADAQDWTLTFEGTPVPGFVPSEAGTLTVTPQSGGTFAFSALNAAGDAHSLELPITVGAPIIKSLKFAVSVVGVGESVSLSWSTLGAETLTLERPDAQATPETLRDLVDATDRAKITADTLSETAVGEETVYTLTLTNNSGSVSREITVLSTPQVAISSLTAGPSSGTSTSDPLELSEGTSIRLDWTAVNADALVLTEYVPGKQPAVFTPAIPASSLRAGSRSRPLPAVTPTNSDTETVTYELKASKGADHVSQTVSVNVVAKPTVTGSSTAPSVANAATRGTPVLINYTSNYAVRVRLLLGTTVLEESTSPSGAFAVSPQTTTTYTLEAYNRLGLKSSAVSVPVHIRPPLLDVQVSQRALVRGAEPLTVSWTTTDADSLEIPGYAELLPNTFQDIRTMGLTADLLPVMRAQQAGLDEARTTFSIPFAISKFGQEFRHLTVAINGWFGLPEGVTEAAPNGHFTGNLSGNSSLPTSSASEKNLFAPYWDDLRVANGRIEWTILGRAPERVVVIQWTDVQHYHAVNHRKGSLTFQARISEQGEVEYHYGTMSRVDFDYNDEGRERASSATIGFQRNLAEPVGMLASHEQAVTVANKKIRFVAPRTVTGAEAAAGSISFHPVSSLSGTRLRFRATGGPTAVTADPYVNVFERGDLLISEVLPFPSGTDGEFIELRNISGATLPDLRGLKVTNAAGQSFTIEGSSPTSTRSLSYSSTFTSSSGYLALNQKGTSGFVYGTGFVINDVEDTLTLSAGATPLVRFHFDSNFGVVQGRSLSLDPHARSLALVEPGAPSSQGGWWCLGRKNKDTTVAANLLPTPGTFNLPCHELVETQNVTFQSQEFVQGAVGLLPAAARLRDSIPFPSGFRFVHGGREFDTFSVHASGFMSLGSSSSGISSVIDQLVYNAAPSATLFDTNSMGTSMYVGKLPTFTIMPFWDEMEPAATGSGQIFMRHDAANGRLILEWAGLKPKSTDAGTGELRFQVHLVKKPTGNDGIEFHYGPLGTSSATCTNTTVCVGSSATTGVTMYEDPHSRAFTIYWTGAFSGTNDLNTSLKGNSKRVLTVY